MSGSDQATGSGKYESQQPVWSYRGYQLSSSDFTTAMVHLFRAEINRANIWRTRLDSTTNWAIVTAAAAISFGFSEPGGNHIVILLSGMIISILLYIESRRYRYYELWSSRVRLMETDFFATMLVPPFQPSADWAESLAENLLQPHFDVSIFEALGRRLRRNYIWLYAILILAWIAKLWLQPQPAQSLSQLFGRASLGAVPGWSVIATVLAFLLVTLIFALITAGLQRATGEVLPSFGEDTEPLRMDESPFEESDQEARQRAWFRRSHRRRQFMCMIITDQAEAVSQTIMSEMRRGVTSLQGVGMYSGKAHQVLLSAVTATEVPHLKALVYRADPSAFVIVSPAQEVLGRGFVGPEA